MLTLPMVPVPVPIPMLTFPTSTIATCGIGGFDGRDATDVAVSGPEWLEDLVADQFEILGC